MVIKSKNISLPPSGKRQVDLDRFGFKPNYRNSYFTIYLPCARKKPYHKSRTHSYIHLKIKQFIPNIWIKLINFCTISEVIGIIPEKIENVIFYNYRHEFDYEHYPNCHEGDIERTSEWLRMYIKDYGTHFNYCYCTSKVFRNIGENIRDLQMFPKNYKTESALFEFRKTENVKELTNTIFNKYLNILRSRYKSWKEKDNHPYRVINFAKKYSPFSFKEFCEVFDYLKNPRANINTFCNESKSDKGIYLSYNKKDKKYYLAKFIFRNLK